MDKPTRCQKCQSENIWRNFHSENKDTGETTYSVVCKSCGYRWKETYCTYLSVIQPDDSQIRTCCPRCDAPLDISITGVTRVGNDKLQLEQHCQKCGGSWNDLFEIRRIEEGKVF